MGTLQDRSTSGGFLCDFRDDDSESNLCPSNKKNFNLM